MQTEETSTKTLQDSQEIDFQSVKLKQDGKFGSPSVNVLKPVIFPLILDDVQTEETENSTKGNSKTPLFEDQSDYNEDDQPEMRVSRVAGRNLKRFKLILAFFRLGLTLIWLSLSVSLISLAVDIFFLIINVEMFSRISSMIYNSGMILSQVIVFVLGVVLYGRASRIKKTTCVLWSFGIGAVTVLSWVVAYFIYYIVNSARKPHRPYVLFADIAFSVVMICTCFGGYFFCSVNSVLMDIFGKIERRNQEIISEGNELNMT